MLNRLILIASICLLQFAQLYSQTPSYYHYTPSNGLASSTVYQIIQDRNGFIWFATINGISRFDGKRFKTFRTNDGLNSNSITSLAEGENGEIYIGNYEKGINILRNDRIENYCSEIGGKGFATSYLLVANRGKEKQKLYTYRSWGLINILDTKETGTRLNYSISTNPQHLIKIEKLPNGKLVILTTSGMYNFDHNILTKLAIKGLPDTVVYCLAKGANGSYFIGTKGMIFKIKGNQIIDKYRINIAGGNEVVSILHDRNGNLWFSIMNNGFFLIPKNSGQIIDVGTKMDIKNTLVNSYLEDNEGNIWIGTYGKGVYCLNNLYLKSYNEKDGLSNNNVYAIGKEKSGKILIGTFNGINILDNGKFVRVPTSSKQTLTENISSIANIDNEFYICGSFGSNKIIDLIFHGVKLHLMVHASFCKRSNGQYLFGYWGNSLLINKELNYMSGGGANCFVIGDSIKINRLNTIFEDSNKNIWIGTNLGLCKLSILTGTSAKLQLKKKYYANNAVLNSKISSITQADGTNLWITGEKGIAQLNLDNDSIKSYSNRYGYDLTSSTSLVFDNKNRLWIGNMKGLYLFDKNSIKLLNTQTGLPSDEIYSLYYDSEKNNLYVGTSNGISVLDINSFDNYVPLSLDVKIMSVKAGDSIYSNFNHLIFKPEQNHVYIDFKALSFSSPGAVKYKYNLNGEWNETANDFLDFVSLEKGKYELNIMAKSQNSEWGKPCSILFEIKPTYYETVWFKLGKIILVVFVSISLVTWWWRRKNSKIRKDLELSERINELKHQALSAMMNPHFIFNALNSVQYLINCKRNEDANDYIAMMAKLVRRNLDTAGSAFILLSDEILRLELYLQLEKLRFQEGFSWEIITGVDVDKNSILIPNMIIQPFVENTLWHGIINAGGKGLVTISFAFEEVNIDAALCRSLVIKITDNGIGIGEAKKHKKEDHISKGIQIVEERLRLLSTKMQLPKPIMLQDLSSRNSFSHGTEVIISLPSPLYKIIGS